MTSKEQNSGKDDIQIICELFTETAKRINEGKISKKQLQDLTGMSNETYEMIMVETQYGKVPLPKEKLEDILIDKQWQLNRLKEISRN